MTKPKHTDTVTFHETGTRLLMALGRWNSPRDGCVGPLAEAWIPIPADVVPAVPSLYAGEHIEMSLLGYPSIRQPLEAAMKHARRPRYFLH